MRDIKVLLTNVERYKTVLLQKSFHSKKNTVVYVILNGQPRVIKWFVPGLKQNMDLEYTIMKKGHTELTMPYPYEKDTENNVLVLSYIMGENVCDIINDPQTNFEEKQTIAYQLAEWLLKFHCFFKTDNEFRLRGDASLRNFILSKGHIYGVDFEESRFGKPSEDLATLCASFLSTDPMFTDEKFELCQIFLDAYRKSAAWNVQNINAEISYALLERIQWRPKDETIFRTYANTIHNKGLHVTQHIFKRIAE